MSTVNPLTPRVPESVIQVAYPAATLSLIGQGGQSDVWHANGPSGDECLRVLIGVDPRRVAHEVDKLRGISSPYLMRFHALDSITHAGTTHPVIRGEYISGGTIATKLDAGGVPTEREALECVSGILEALCLLHDADAIHRDVKPPNVALRGGLWTSPVLLDLGLIRVVTASSLTIYPSLVGTALYMAPEQLRREPPKMRSDVFATAVVLFLLLTQAHPFIRTGEALTLQELIDRIEDPRWPDPALVAAISPGLQGLVSSMLAPPPHQRPSATRARSEVRTYLGTP